MGLECDLIDDADDIDHAIAGNIDLRHRVDGVSFLKRGVRQYRESNRILLTGRDARRPCDDHPSGGGRSRQPGEVTAMAFEDPQAAGFWQMEVATLLSQIGYVSLPMELAEKLYYGERQR